ncbi:MAG TPA: phosphatase PAP2 family protein [Abditibacteriaceae bacterium]|jgi:membrane-associated phospholipid phosphatase
MQQILELANIRIIIWLNHWLALHPKLYKVALFVTDEFADIATVLTLLLLWFWPQKKSSMLEPVQLPKAGEEVASGASRLRPAVLAPKSAGLKKAMAPTERIISRDESRAMLITFGIAGMLAYVTARMIAITFPLDRPFMSYLPIYGIPGAFEGLREFGTFPSDHAALLGALPVAVAYWKRNLAWLWVGLGVVLGITRVAVGFHYPLDMVGGAIVGIAYTWTFMSIYARGGKLHFAMNSIAKGFHPNNAPYCYFLYFGLFLVGLEFVMHFKHVLGIILQLRGEIAYRLS